MHCLWCYHCRYATTGSSSSSVSTNELIDQYLGKFKTIVYSVPIYVAGMIILVATATPSSIKSNAAMGGLVTMMILVGLGTGGLKACIAPLSGEQNPTMQSYVTTTKKGERVVVDSTLTSASIFMW